MASCCVPVIFNPINIDGDVYVDGGIMDNLPAKPIRDNCDFLIGSSSNYIRSDFDVKNFRSVVERSLLLAISGNTVVSKQLCDIVIDPPKLGSVSVFDVRRARELFEIGYTFMISNCSRDDFKR